MVTYRLLPKEEWHKLEALHAKSFPDLPVPAPETAACAVAETAGGKVVGYWFMQLCAHMEPCAIDPSYSQEVSLHQMRNELHKAFSYECPGMAYYCSTPDPAWDEALRYAGFRPIGLAYVSNIPEVMDT